MTDLTFNWGAIDENRFALPDAGKHFCILGATGSGKTVTMRLLMQQVLPPIPASKGYRAVVYDAKQDMLSYLLPIVDHRAVWNQEVSNGIRQGRINEPSPEWVPPCIKILNPFDRRSSAWDLAADVTAPATAQQIAGILVPEETNTAQPFFADATRHLLYGVLLALIQKKQLTGYRWSLRDVLLAMNSENALRSILAGNKYTKHLPDMYLNKGSTLNSIKATIATKLMPFEIVAAMWEKARDRVSLRDFLDDEKPGAILVLGNDEENRAALDSINRVIFTRITQLLIGKPEAASPNTWVFLDEVREMGRLDALGSLLLRGRSKGASVVLGLQDIDGLRDLYGEYRAHEIVAQCGFKAVLKLESPTTAEWAAKHFGETEDERPMPGGSISLGKEPGHSEGWQMQIVKREAVLYSQLMTIPPPMNSTLRGFYVTPLGRYEDKVDFGGDHLKQIPGCNFIPRPEAEQYLEPWKPEELKRLGISEPKESPESPQPVRGKLRTTDNLDEREQ